MPQLATPRRRWIGRKIRLVRGHRLHVVEATARAVECSDPVVHGAPPGDEPARLRLCVVGATDAEALRVRAALPGDVASSSGAHSETHGVSFACYRSFRPPRD